MGSISDEYKSIKSASLGEYASKGSKFIGFSIPFEKEENLKTELLKIKEQHPKARHWCYAYKIGVKGEKYRINDDGEPSGSAGKPIFGRINSANISDVLIVVVRYFGGTKLGIPGLIKAYGSAAKNAIENAQIITKTKSVDFKINFDFAVTNQVMKYLKNEQLKIQSQIINNKCEIIFSSRLQNAERHSQYFQQISNLKIEMLQE